MEENTQEVSEAPVEEAPEQPESGTTEEESDGTVELTEASDEEIEAFLNGELEIEKTENEQDAQPEEEAQPDAEQKEASDEPVETAPEEENDSASQEELNAEYVKKLEERLDQQEAFIKRRSSELGELRSELRSREKELQTLLKDEDLSPEELVDAKLKLKEAKEKQEEVDAEDEAIQRVFQSQAVVHKNVKPEEWNVQAMTESLKEDGVPPESIQAFAQNPYSAADGLTLVQLAKRAKAETALRTLAAYTKKLMEENKALKEKPGEVLKKVEKNLNSPSQLTSSNGGSGSTRGLSVDASQLHALSDDELEALIG